MSKDRPSTNSNGSDRRNDCDNNTHTDDEVGVGCLSGQFLEWGNIVTFAQYCPLLTAILAPLATLMDIPALTQRWYINNGVTQDDPPASLILSAVGLALNVVANVLLIMRFSSKSRRWIRQTVIWSTTFWIAKTVIAVVNLVVYGIYERQEGNQFTEGFWCAVVSVCVAGIISLALLVHFCFAFNRPIDDEPASVRSSGRKFMLSVTIFLSIIALQSLVFSRIEKWSYSDGIYFSIQTALTIGYGDYTPSTTAGKVLVFPFAILTISQLGNEISLIVDFIRVRSRERRTVWRKKYEGAIHREAELLRPRASLLDEMRLVHEINKREAWMSQMLDLLWSAISLLSFWLIGAVIFSAIEGWTYGNAVYACIVTSVTIGFGDFTPETPAGKVYFIPFVLLAVPIVTSFAVQTITGLLSTFSNRGHVTDAIRRAVANGADWCRPHHELVEKHRGAYERLLASQPTSFPGSAGVEGQVEGSVNQQQLLVQQLLDRVIKLETQARGMLLDNLEHGVARTLLVADRNVQARNIGEDRESPRTVKPTPLDEMLDQDQSPELGGDTSTDTLDQVEGYRSLFAEILVLGSSIQELDGTERARFERRPVDSARLKDDQTREEIEEGALEAVREDGEKELGGLTRILYRQHAKKLKKAYTVA